MKKVSYSEQRIRDDIDHNINNKLGGPVTDAMLADANIEAETPMLELYEDDSDDPHGHTPDIDDVTPEEADNYVGASVTLPIENDQRSGKVTRRARDQDGNLVGTSNRVPILWKEGTSTWERLADLKESYPIDVA